MENSPQNPEGDAARRSAYGDYTPGTGAATQRVDPPAGTYVPPELRPAPEAPQPQYTRQGPAYGTQPVQPIQQVQPVAQPAYTQTLVRERQRHGAPIVGPVILIGAGALFLLNTLDIVSWNVWDQLWRLWPLILIAVGLDILVGRRSALLSLLIVVALIGGGAAIVLFNGGFQSTGNLMSTDLNIPAGGARTADVNIKFGAGELTLDGAANAESLASGTLEYYENSSKPTQDTSVNSGRAILTLQQSERSSSIGPFFGDTHRSPSWTVHLNPAVQTALSVDLGAGNSMLDLSGISLSHLTVSSGAGNATVVVPSSLAESVNASISGGVGNIHVRVPDGTEARVKVSSGLGNVNFDSRFTKDGNTYTSDGYGSATRKIDIEVSHGVGNVEISR